MITRTITLTDRMHAVLMHALDCAGAWCDEEWEADERHVAGLTPLVEPLDDLVDLRKLRNICKAAKISKPAAASAAGDQMAGAAASGSSPGSRDQAPAAGEGTTLCDLRCTKPLGHDGWHFCVRGDDGTMPGGVASR